MRTARAKGLSRRLVISLHALPNALLPVITLSGVLLGFVLAGSIPVERAFGTPGLGYAMFTAVERARRLRHAEPGVPLCRRVRAAEHRGRCHDRLARSRGSATDEQPIPMTATFPTEPLPHRRPSRHALAAGAASDGSSGARRCRPSGAASPPRSSSWRSPRPCIAPYEPLKSDFRAMTKPPDEKHWFGTDQIGRDTLSRVIYGSRASLTVAFGAVLFGTTVGALWGLACGYFGGRFDMVSQRLIEFLQSFPDLILAMAIAMALGGRHGHGDRGDRDHPHPVRRPGDPLGRAVAEGDVVCRGGARARRLASAADVAPHPAAMRGALPDPGDDPSRRRDHHRGLARLSRASASRRRRRPGATCWPIR